MTFQRRALIWQDAQGEQTLHLITSKTGASAIQTELLAKSNAVVLEESEGAVTQTTATPSTASYPTSRVVAVLLFLDSRTGSSARLYIPAPLPSIFMGGGDTVDPAQVAGIISAALGNLLAGSGNTVDMFVGGFLNKVRPQPLESTQAVAFVNPMTSTGDLIYSTDNAGDAGRLPIGTAGEVLTVSGGLPVWGAAGPGSGGAMSAINSAVLAAPATFIEVTGIPGTFKTLVIYLMAGSNQAVTMEVVNLILNGDTSGADYASSFGGQRVGLAFGTSAPHNGFGNVQVIIGGYTDTTGQKTAIATAARNDNSVPDFGQVEWFPATPQAITAVRFAANAGNLIAGTRLDVYGLS